MMEQNKKARLEDQMKREKEEEAKREQIRKDEIANQLAK